MQSVAEKLFSLSKKRALVCGASAGIGRAIARMFAQSGAEVGLLARSEEALEALRSEIEAEGGKATTLVCDLEDLEGTQAIVEGWADYVGGLDILVCNAGGPPAGSLLDVKPEVLVSHFHRHLAAAQMLAQLAVPRMQKSGYGRIITITSTSVKEPIVGLGNSNCVRWAMAAWVKTLSKELPPNITVNNILPGFTDTPRLESLLRKWAEKEGVSLEEMARGFKERVPENRFASPEETAAAALFLASPAASYIRGVNLPVDGGRMASL